AACSFLRACAGECRVRTKPRERHAHLSRPAAVAERLPKSECFREGLIRQRPISRRDGSISQFDKCRACSPEISVLFLQKDEQPRRLSDRVYIATGAGSDTEVRRGYGRPPTVRTVPEEFDRFLKPPGCIRRCADT